MPLIEAKKEPSPREKVERARVLARRARSYWRGALALTTVVTALGVLVVVKLPRVYESETVLLARDAIRTDTREDGPDMRASRIGPKVKDLLLARSRLEKIIGELHLYPALVEQRGLVEAVEQMRTQIGFRARDSDTFLISFQAETPELARSVAARLADSMIEEFVHDSLERTSAARDFLVDEEKRAEQDVEVKGRELAEFVSRHPEFAFDPTKPTPAFGAGLAAPKASARSAGAVPGDPELAALYRDRARLEARLGGAPVARPESSQVKALEQAQAKALADLSVAQADVAEKRQRLTSEHPDLIAARNQAIAAGRALGVAQEALSRARAAAELPSVDEGVGGDDPQQRLAAVRAAIAARERALAHGGAAPQVAADGGAPVAGRGLGTVALETEWQRLVRAATEARQHKEDVAGRRARAELLASAAVQSGSMVMTVIDPAFRPTKPKKPNRTVLASLVAVVGAVLGALYAFAGVLLDDVIFDATDVATLGGAEVLAVVPRHGVRGGDEPAALAKRVPVSLVVPSGPRPVVTPPPPVGERDTRPMRPRDERPTRPNAPLALALAHSAPGLGSAFPLVRRGAPPRRRTWEPTTVVGYACADDGGAAALGRLVGPKAMSALRLLRHRIEQRADGRTMILGVTSPRALEGKSTVAAQLALALAESERARVLLVEANLERPSLEALLGLEVPEGRGFSTQMHRRMSQALRSSWEVVALGPSLHVLAEATGDPRWPAALHSREFHAAIEELRPGYDYVVVDGPSVLELGDATAVEAVVDGVILVARAGVSTKAELAAAQKVLGERRWLGVVLSGAEESS